MNKREFFFEMLVACLVLGVLMVWQFKSQENFKLAQDPEAQEIVAVEVARLSASNAELRKALADLSKQEFNIAEAINDQKKAEVSIQEKQEKADILSGVTRVTGPGIIFTINNELTAQQLIDVVNALKNIGAEAISINGERLTNKYSIWRSELRSPYKIEVIGSPAGLSTALTRRGGIIDQIESSSGVIDYKLSEQERIVLSGTEVSAFKYAKTVEQSE